MEGVIMKTIPGKVRIIVGYLKAHLELELSRNLSF